MERKNASFEFFNDYSETVESLQPEFYAEMSKIIDNYGNSDSSVLDIGGAGHFPYSVEKFRSVSVLDLFEKPKNQQLPSNTQWEKGDILDHSTLPKKQFDLVICGSLLHHLCGPKNGAQENIQNCFKNIRRVLAPEGKLLIFESTCHPFLAKLQDLLYPITSRFLIAIGFTYVRMFSKNEILRAAQQSEIDLHEIAFQQPKFIAQWKFRVPLKLYPLRISSFEGRQPN